jgi:alanine-glyoxylate transaminase/serine-glyoxylate transaminase/serine-pyruvate transaminase
MSNAPRRAGRHYLQIPGPTPVPDRILRAMDMPVIDHRGPEFKALGLKVLAGIKTIFKTSSPVFIYPSSGTGAWEAALVNTLSPGDRVLAFDTGHFAGLWSQMARTLGLEVELVPGSWRRGVDPERVQLRLAADHDRSIRALMVVHNETSTGVTSDIRTIRAAVDAAGHPALLLVDTVSSLASMDYRHDEWGVDVTVACSQKGLMLPPGLGFNALGERALAAAGDAGLGRSYWDWRAMLAANADGHFPYTPPTNLLYGLREALAMLSEEGLENVFARHRRHAEATRQAVRAWGLEVLCQDPARYSSSLTAVLVGDGGDADRVRQVALERYDLSLGAGLGRLAGRVFRIGHLGSLNDLMLAGTLCGVELSLARAGAGTGRGGVEAALDHLRGD